MTLAIFRASGYSPFRMDKLNSFDRVSATIGADMLVNVPGSSSLPVDFFGFIFPLIIWSLVHLSHIGEMIVVQDFLEIF